ncbi:hypothetical protein L602_000500001330 [Cupriavidus gilardii J11]|uniref:Uncharacterized protein n=1 Tax=Cupriavidus gilardii J11 TaxID=936133 RepID=A0A562B5I6_9BURK|nr:hypothetical protein [Cupriavidus gilardii]TWG80487.1 hypothetical protein L602_000500001330 [Cupriavidus gilardii J11]
MARLNAYAPVQHFNDIAGRASDREARKSPNIRTSIWRLNLALGRCEHKRFIRFYQNGSPVREGRIDVQRPVTALARVRKVAPRYGMLPGNRKKAIETLDKLTNIIERLGSAIDLFNDASSASEAERLLSDICANLQAITGEISTQIPDESTKRPIRDGIQIGLLVLSVGAFVAVNILSLGLPTIALAAVSLLPPFASFLCNRTYDWCTTPCSIWKPMRDMAMEIRHSVEISSMYTSSVINRLESRFDEQTETMHELASKTIRQCESRIQQETAAIAERLESRIQQETIAVIHRTDALEARIEKMIADNEASVIRLDAFFDKIDVALAERQALLEERNLTAQLARQTEAAMQQQNQHLAAVLALFIGSDGERQSGPLLATTVEFPSSCRPIQPEATHKRLNSAKDGLSLQVVGQLG